MMVRFESVSKSFGSRTVLNSVSFTASEGQILFILGTSGTGKSVLLKSIVGLLAIDQGNLWVDTYNVSGFSEEQFRPVRKICGMVFQQPALFDSLSVFENVAYGLRRGSNLSESAIHKRVAESLALVQLANINDKRPGQISYGMQKRVSLARTIAVGPKILLFDEPTTGLDPINTTAVNQLIQKLSRELKTTSLVVSHDMRCALEIADHIIVLDRGEIVEQGSPQQLLKSRHPLVCDFLKEAQ